MTKDVVIVLDCGATNVRAIAVDRQGRVVAKAALQNAARPAQENTEWYIWPLDNLFEKFSLCCQQVVAQIDPERVAAVTVTTFGVDGTLVDHCGNPMHPVISWKCPRTNESQQRLRHYIDPDKLAITSGVGHFAFNTVNKLVWFRENKPGLLADAHGWMFISSLFTRKLTGRMTTDATMAGTAQLTCLETQSFNSDVLSALGLGADFFPEMVQAGDVIGELLPGAAKVLGLPAGIPVVSAGHDTQFAVFGSGAEEGQLVLSSGTWEILMARASSVKQLSPDIFDNGFTCEWDARKGFYNPGIQWLASGVLEWVGRQFYPGIEGAEKYAQMIAEAFSVPSGCNGVCFNPEFLTDRNGKANGAISGLSLDTGRGVIYRAALEALAFKLKDSLRQLGTLGGFKASELILVGSGSRNQLWNQIKADVLQLPVKVLSEPETTALGASMFAMAGSGIYDSPESARAAFAIRYEAVLPGTGSSMKCMKT